MVVDQGSKPAIAVACIVNGCLDRGLQSIVAAIAIEARVPGKFLRMIPQAELVVGLIKVAQAKDHFALTIALKAGAWHYVEDSISTVSQAGPIAPPVHLEIIDILGIDLGSDIAGD